MTRALWGKAKLEVYILKREILALLKQGENLDSAFHILTKEKKLTISARTFRRHAAAYRAEAQAFFSQPIMDIQTASGTSKAEIAKPAARSGGPVIRSSFAEDMRRSGGKELLKKPSQPDTTTQDAIKPSSPPKPTVRFVHKSDGASDALSAAYGEPQSPASKPDKRKQSIDKT